jgi:hypothetical protein
MTVQYAGLLPTIRMSLQGNATSVSVPLLGHHIQVDVHQAAAQAKNSLGKQEVLSVEHFMLRCLPNLRCDAEGLS